MKNFGLERSTYGSVYIGDHHNERLRENLSTKVRQSHIQCTLNKRWLQQKKARIYCQCLQETSKCLLGVCIQLAYESIPPHYSTFLLPILIRDSKQLSDALRMVFGGGNDASFPACGSESQSWQTWMKANGVTYIRKGRCVFAMF